MKFPAQPKCLTSLLFVLVLYLFDVLSFVLHVYLTLHIKEHAVSIVKIMKTFSLSRLGDFAI